jgi:HEAT repeat protein
MRSALLFVLALGQAAAAEDPSKEQVLGLLSGYEETASPDSLKALRAMCPRHSAQSSRTRRSRRRSGRGRSMRSAGSPTTRTARSSSRTARGGNPMFARKAVYALANGWGDQAIDELTVALANPDVQTRMAAASALGHMATPSAKLALEARLAYETDPTVRNTIEKQMGK